MGKRGPKPTPLKVLKLRGSWRGNVNHESPEDTGSPDVPERLTEEEAIVWFKVTEELSKLNLLSRCDFGVLERYCTFFVRWRRCEDVLREKGVSYEIHADRPDQFIVDPGGDKPFVVGYGVYPEANESIRLDSALRQLETMLGLSPSARSRLSSPTGDDKPKDDLKSKYFG